MKPPHLHNLDAEALLIGKLLTNPKAIEKAADTVTSADFHEPFFGDLFGLIVREFSAGRSVSPVTIIPHVIADPRFAEVGGPAFIASLTGNSAILLTDAAPQIADLASRRRLVEALQATIEQAADLEQSVAAIVDSADAALVEATHTGDPIHQPTGAQCIEEVIAGLDNPIQGVTCRVIGCLDALIGPLRPKQLTILAGRPGMGKTAVAVSYALGAAQSGHGVLFVSLEMSSTELGARMAADLCFDGTKGVPFSAIRDGSLHASQIRKLQDAAAMMRDMPLRVLDLASLSIGRLNMMVRRHKRRMAAQGQSLDLVIVDYLQLLHGNNRNASRYEAVSEVSRGLKELAKEYGVSVVALAQLNRDVEKRPDKRPQLSDLKESGQLEQDADNVLFLLREEYYLRSEEPEPNTSAHVEWHHAITEVQGKIEFILAKARNGVVGKRTGQFIGAYQAVRGEA